MKYTPENIIELKPNEIFVFGSNMWGRHSGGAAKQACEDFDAEWGINEGLSGQTYAFPTLEREMTKRGLRALENSRDRLFATARALPEKTFLLTKVGCGIAGHKEEDIAPLFKNAPDNVIKPEGW
jgi:hypothetical protein